ncbi:MAG: hypothetical protein KID00_03285 [Clostridium argentinense]|uniref:DUF3784 domain-containing protein n=1 Tax=Clostridium faecium TaxID=2762223 RepID=A0ABR8YPT7_9CLOT|nr:MULTISPECIES: hypothetical protein [Clostridium]MBD8046028.1 hypothetical protein [Clostridium faecium]MBS5822877.1 hypothetical protein [Clostridium argentinense]MDU1349110.1 hypothetical protein [Clostridium argentinense]
MNLLSIICIIYGIFLIIYSFVNIKKIDNRNNWYDIKDMNSFLKIQFLWKIITAIYCIAIAYFYAKYSISFLFIFTIVFIDRIVFFIIVRLKKIALSKRYLE